MFPDDVLTQAEALLSLCRTAGIRLATAESCTGGLIAATLTEVAGSSDVFDRGFVTYSNEAKVEMLGIPESLIETYGAVSPEVAVAMAEGALSRSGAGLAVAVTGIAGPSGGTADKPVGLVHMAATRRGEQTRHVEHRFGNPGRSEVRLLTVREAIAYCMALAETGP